MVHFVGAGPGAVDLITLRGVKLLAEADVIIYAGSLVNPELLAGRKESCLVYNSASMTLEEVLAVMWEAEKNKCEVVRLHTGDPALYGAVREQMDQLDQLEIPYDVTPGVSSFSGAAAALRAEYTLPNVSQTVIITRAEGRTPVPKGEKLRDLAAHQATMVLFLSAGLLPKVEQELIAGGYPPETSAAIVYKATWPDEKVFYCTVDSLAKTARENGIHQTALIAVGQFLDNQYDRSRLYDPSFSHGYREAVL